MRSFVRNSCCFLLLALIACTNVTITHPEGNLTIQSDTTPAAKTYTILLSGMPPSPFYDNAQDIIEKRYKIEFIYAAGCIVSDRLGDSIQNFNDKTFSLMSKDYNTKMSDKIWSETDAEYRTLIKTDSILKNAPALKKYPWTKDIFPYYKKLSDGYLSYFIVNYLDKKSGDRPNKLKLQVKIQGTKIKTITEKDSIISGNLKELQ